MNSIDFSRFKLLFFFSSPNAFLLLKWLLRCRLCFRTEEKNRRVWRARTAVLCTTDRQRASARIERFGVYVVQREWSGQHVILRTRCLSHGWRAMCVLHYGPNICFLCSHCLAALVCGSVPERERVHCRSAHMTLDGFRGISYSDTDTHWEASMVVCLMMARQRLDAPTA